MKIAPIYLLIHSTITTASASASASASDLGLDIATLRALGLSEDDDMNEQPFLEDNEDEDDVRMISDGVLNVLDGYIDNDESENMNEDYDNENESAWWRNPLGQFSDDVVVDGEEKDIVVDTFEDEEEEEEDMLSPILSLEEEDEDEEEEKTYSYVNALEDSKEEAEETEDELSDKAKQRLAEQSILPKESAKVKSKRSSKKSKMKGKLSALDISLPMNIILPAMSITQIRNLLSTVVGGSPIMGIMLSLIAGHYAMILASKSASKGKIEDAPSSSSVDSISSALSESPNGFINRNMFGELNENADMGSNVSNIKSEQRTKDFPVLKQIKKVFRKKDPNEPTSEDLKFELESLKKALQRKDLEKASLTRDKEEASNQVSQRQV